MAYDGTKDANGNAQGHGFMSSSADKKNDSLWFAFTEESLRDERASIGNKGLNFPVTFEFNGSNAAYTTETALRKTPNLYFKGLATKDKNGLVTVIAGQVEGLGFAPAHEAKDTTRSKEQGHFAVTENNSKKLDSGVYYPGACLDPNDASKTDEAHFYGTFTTRYNKAKTTAANKTTDAYASAKSYVNSKCPRK